MAMNRRTLIKLGAALTGAFVTTAEPRGACGAGDAPPVRAADSKEMQAWWADLEKDEPEASRALLKFADRPRDAVAFLASTMKPLNLDPDRLKELLTKLGNVDENDWAPAYEELDYFDPRLAVDLETLMRTVIDSPTRQRMVAVLSGRAARSLEGQEIDIRRVRDIGFNFVQRPGGSWWAEHDIARMNTRFSPKKKWTRAVRAIALLEHIGTPESIAVLKNMATGHPLAQPTRVALEALDRISAKGQ